MTNGDAYHLLMEITCRLEMEISIEQNACRSTVAAIHQQTEKQMCSALLFELMTFAAISRLSTQYLTELFVYISRDSTYRLTDALSIMQQQSTKGCLLSNMCLLILSDIIYVDQLSDMIKDQIFNAFYP